MVRASVMIMIIIDQAVANKAVAVPASNFTVTYSREMMVLMTSIVHRFAHYGLKLHEIDAFNS